MIYWGFKETGSETKNLLESQNQRCNATGEQ